MGRNEIFPSANLPNDPDRVRVLPVDRVAIPMEPRVMLDANLEWDLNSTTAIISVVSSISQSLDALLGDAGDLSEILDTLDETAGQAADIIATVTDTAGQIGLNDLSVVTTAVTNVRDAITELQTKANDLVDDFIGASVASDIADEYNDLRNGDGTDAMDADDVTGVLTLDNFRDGTVNQAVDDMTATFASGTAYTAENARDRFDQAVSNVLGLPNGNLGITLSDIEITVGGGSPLKLVDFENPDVNDATTVNAAINLPESIFDVTAALNAALPGVSLPFDFEIGGGGGKVFGFDIVTDTVFTGDALDSVALGIKNFTAVPLFEAGGLLTLPSDASIGLGFLELQADSVEIPTIQVAIDGLDAVDLGATVSFANPVPDVTFNGPNTLPGIVAKIKEIGGTSFNEITEQRYDLLDLEFSGALAFSGFDQNFDGGIVLSSVLDSNGAAGRIQSFFDALDLDFEISPTDGSLDPAVAEAIAGSLESLVALGVDEIVDFLKTIGETVADALVDSALDFEIPLTDVRFSSILSEVASVFLNLADTFQISPDSLGFIDVSALPDEDDTNLGSDIVAETGLTVETDSQTGRGFSVDQFNFLTGLTELTLGVLPGDGTEQTLVLDLTASDPDLDIFNGNGSQADRLAAFASYLTGQLATSFGISVSLSKFGGFSVNSTSNGSGDPANRTYATFGVRGAKTGSDSEDVSLFDLGFDVPNISKLTDEATGAVFETLRFAVEQTSFDLGAVDLSDLEGVNQLRFGLLVDGVDQFIDVEKTDVWDNLDDLIGDFNTALGLKGLGGDGTSGFSIGQNAAGDGFSLELAADEIRSFALKQDTSQLLRALDIEGLIGWVNSELTEVFPGAELELTDGGELIFNFPDLEKTLSLGISASDNVEDGSEDDPDVEGPADVEKLYLSTEDLDLGIFNNIELSGLITADFEAMLQSAIGINLVDFGKDVIGSSSADNAVEASRGTGDRLIDAVLDNVFINDLSVAANVKATAEQITGGADLGIVSVTLGGTDPNANFAVIHSAFEASLVGTDSDGAFNEKVTFRNLQDAVIDKVDLEEKVNKDDDRPVSERVEFIKAPGVDSLLGKFELLGGVIVDDGQGLTAGGDAAGTLADVQVTNDPFSYSGAGKTAQLLVNIGDVSVNVAGIDGINDGIVSGVSVSIDDLVNPTDTFDLKLLVDGATPEEIERNQKALDSLTNLEDGDILDTLVSIANVLVVVGDTLSDKLPFLADDIPLLNISILDQISFAADFLEALQQLRNDPQSGLEKVEVELEKIFGDGNVSLNWLADEQTITFDLSFSFLDDFQKTLPFQFDLAELLGEELEKLIGSDLAEVVSGLVDASGDGELIFDPLLDLNFSFGIDLSPTLATPSEFAELETALTDLATVSQVNFRPDEGNDLRIVWANQDTGETRDIEIDFQSSAFGEVETLADIVGIINSEAQRVFGDPSVAGEEVSFTYDESTGTVTLSDTRADQIDTTDVNSLFGEDRKEAADVGGTKKIALDPGFSDFSAGQEFTIEINGTPVELSLEENNARTTQSDFIIALNNALTEASVARTAISDSAGPFLSIDLSQLLRVEEDGGDLFLVETNFGEFLGYSPIEFAVAGKDTSEPIEFRVISLAGSNIGKALGLEDASDGIVGDVVSQTLFKAVSIGAPRVFLDTEKTGIKASFIAGVNDGLNIQLGLGPLTVQVQNGKALITAGLDDNGDPIDGPAFVSLEINDIDGVDDGEYDLSHLFDIPGDPNKSFADLFKVGGGIGIDLNLPFSDSLGLFDPSTDGLTWNVNLLSLPSNFDLASVTDGNILDKVGGELTKLFKRSEGVTVNDLMLPDISIDFDGIIADFLGDFNVLGLLNDPRATLGGLDVIMRQAQNLFDDFLGGISIPIVGDAIGVGVTFFDEFRYKILEPALEFAQTPLDDGTLPSTVDLLTGFVNDALNDQLGTSNTTYLQAELDTSGSLDESFLWGTLNFSGVVFDADVEIDFDFGIPGFDLEVEQGSKIRMTLTYGLNVGFGVDRNGFFLLNDVDDPEATINFEVDAGTFEGSATVLKVLGLKAKAADLDKAGDLDETLPGKARLSADLFANLYGQTGLEIKSEASRPNTLADGKFTTMEAIYRDFDYDEVTPALGGKTLEWERQVYVAQLDTSDLIAFGFQAEIDVVAALEGNVLDPGTGEPLTVTIDGEDVQIIPSVNAELVFSGSYGFNSDSVPDGLMLNALGLENVRVDARELYYSLLEPILSPIADFVEPLAGFFDFLNSEPLTYVVDILGNVFPIIKLAGTISKIADQAIDFVNFLDESGGIVMFGDFDFSDNFDSLNSGETKAKDLDKRDIARTKDDRTKTSGSFTDADGASNTFGTFGDPSGGLSITLPLLQDPFSAIGILTGNFDEVDLVTAKFTLFDLDTGQLNIAEIVLEELNMPGWVSDIVSSFFGATIDLRLKAAFEVGYDLSGIVNFANTLDPERLLDGVFINAEPGALVDARIAAAFNLNAGLAGLEAEGFAGVRLSFNDPNEDGKLRIPELIAIVEAAADQAFNNNDPVGALGYIFRGDAEYGFKLSVWAGINFPSPIPDLKWSTTLFDFSDEIDFGGNKLPVQISQDVSDTNGAAILNVGARAGGSFSDIEEDGDDVITVGANSSPALITVTSGGITESGTTNGTPESIIIPAGDGNNTVNLRNASVPTLTFTGAGTDIVNMPRSGFHVVFAGGSRDVITIEEGSTGTYVVFGEAGDDVVKVVNATGQDVSDPGASGNVVYFGDTDFGMRQVFLDAFSNGGNTANAMAALLNLDPTNSTIAANGNANYVLGTDNLSLTELLLRVTEGTQAKASSDDETVIMGGGNAIIVTGGGDDQIDLGLTGAGVVNVFSGGGDDQITAGGTTVLVEAGAGRDLVQVDGPNTVVWGWGAAAGEAGLLDTSGLADTNPAREALVALNALAIRDGEDILIGGSGQDRLFGQLGEDIIEGRAGNDEIGGGINNDFLTGGVFEITRAGVIVDIATLDITAQLTNGLLIATQYTADGDDTLRGGSGSDVLLGGGGSDNILGESGNDVLLGDFANLALSANLIAEGAITTFDTDILSFAGTDTLDGGEGDDILVAGSARDNEIEILRDLFGSNTFLGDFGQIEGARILEFVTKLSSIGSVEGGPDTMVSGRGNDLHIGGEGDDVISSGLGGDLILGDLGVFDITGGTVTALASATDGNDVITVGIDTPAAYTTPATTDLTDIVAGGLGNDTIISGDGNLVVIGDAGVFGLNPVGLNALRTFMPAPPEGQATQEQLDQEEEDLARVKTIIDTIETTPDSGDGNDTVTSSGGDVSAALGGGDDDITLADGVNYVLGDDGTITFAYESDTTLKEAALTSNAAGGEGNDTFKLTGGATTLIAGGGSDNAMTTSLDTLDAVMDNGVITSTPTRKELSSTDPGTGSDDSVTSTGDGTVLAILGDQDDATDLGSGTNVVLADNGTIVSDEDGISLVSSASATGGQDSVTTAEDATDLVILGDDSDMADLGGGTNVVLADNGTIVSDEDGISLISSASATGGQDSVTTAEDATDLVILGDDNDTADLGDGFNAVLGDTGEIVQNQLGTTLTASESSTGGDDAITSTGEATDLTILGDGNDRADLGGGFNAVLGDGGTIVQTDTAIALTSDATLGGGDDRVTTTGDGSALAILGNGDDAADLGDGFNAVLGDNGTIVSDTSGVRLTSSGDAIGGDDRITTGSSDDVVIAGLGDDDVSTGSGNDAIAGDDASYRSATGIVAGLFSSSFETGPGGDDTITSGDGNDLVIAGEGDDIVDVGAGEDVPFGDDASVVFRNSTDVESVTFTNLSEGGDDVITANGLPGDNILVGQGGNDRITGGSDDDIIIGDLATIELQSVETKQSGQSAVDRVTNMTSIRIDIAGDDVLDGGQGADFILGGFGDDELFGNDGQDFLIGDTIIYDRTLNFLISGEINEELTLDTNFAFEIGGNDRLDGGDGADVMIAGLGPDLFFGDTANDLIFSDAYAGLFKSTYSTDGFNGATPQRDLFTSNFAGAGALDVVSDAQQKQSIGAPLEDQFQEIIETLTERRTSVEGVLLTTPLEIIALTPDVISQILGFLDSDAFIVAIAQLQASGVDAEVLRAAIISALIGELETLAGVNAAIFEVLIKEIADSLVAALANADATAQNEVELALVAAE